MHTAIKDLKADEIAMYNSKARVHILADGTIEADDGSGAVALATKADVDAIEAFLDLQFDTVNGHFHSGGSGGPVTGPTTGSGDGSGFPVPTPAGTSVFKGK